MTMTVRLTKADYLKLKDAAWAAHLSLNRWCVNELIEAAEHQEA
jgi:predicted HicB family RNase H-like nuclease